MTDDAMEPVNFREDRRPWEAEARRAAQVLGAEAQDYSSFEAQMLKTLDAILEDFAKDWVCEAEANDPEAESNQ